MPARVIVETVNVRSQDRVSRTNVVGTLDRGAVVNIVGAAPNPRFAQIVHNGAPAFVSRRFLAEDPPRRPSTVRARFVQTVDNCIWDASDAYNHVEYLLGHKCRMNPAGTLTFRQNASGRDAVDCSGWIAGLTDLIAQSANAAAGAQVFSSAHRNAIRATHSDGQLWHIGQAAGAIVSGADIDNIELRSGMVFGLNKGTYDWESGIRVFEIDHIVMGVRNGGDYFITQSSGGLGVNRVRWNEWRASNATLFSDSRIHCADLLTLGQWP